MNRSFLSPEFRRGFTDLDIQGDDAEKESSPRVEELKREVLRKKEQLLTLLAQAPEEMQKKTADLFTNIDQWIIPAEKWSMILGTLYYAHGLYKKKGDAIIYLEHLACCITMIPMCGLKVDGEYTAMSSPDWTIPLEQASLVAMAGSLSAWVITAASRLTDQYQIRKGIPANLLTSPDVHHAIMFGCMKLMYQMHVEGLTDEYQALMKAGGLACAVIGALPLERVINNPSNLTGAKRVNQLVGSFLHFVMFEGTAGMAWLPKYFMQ